LRSWSAWILISWSTLRCAACSAYPASEGWLICCALNILGRTLIWLISSLKSAVLVASLVCCRRLVCCTRSIKITRSTLYSILSSKWCLLSLRTWSWAIKIRSWSILIWRWSLNLISTLSIICWRSWSLLTDSIIFNW